MQTNQQLEVEINEAARKFLVIMQHTGLVARVVQVKDNTAYFRYQITPMFESIVMPVLRDLFKDKDWQAQLDELQATKVG